MRVWLIRHGESEANSGARTADPAAVALTPRGAEQARALALRFDETPDLIVTSPFLRTKQTAAPLNARFPAVPLEEWAVQEFTYLAPGTCVHTSFMERDPLVRRYWELSDPAYCDGPGAESFTGFMERVEAARRELERRAGRFIALFSHQQFIAALLWRSRNPDMRITAGAMREYQAFLLALSLPNTGVVNLRDPVAPAT